MWELVKAVYTDAISVFLAQRCLYVFIYFLYLTSCVTQGGKTKPKWDKHSLSYLFDFMYLFGVMSL